LFACNQPRRAVQKRILRVHVKVHKALHLFGGRRILGFFLFLLAFFRGRLLQSSVLGFIHILFLFRFRHVTSPFALLFLSLFAIFSPLWICSRPAVPPKPRRTPFCVPNALSKWLWFPRPLLRPALFSSKTLWLPPAAPPWPPSYPDCWQNSWLA